VKLPPELRDEVDRMVAEALGQDLPAARTLVGGRSAPGDQAALRGIPVIGGASGEIPGTRPDRQRKLDYWKPRAWDG
jgi:hypothetical protein